VEKPEVKHPLAVSGLICVGGRLEGNVLVPHDGLTEMPMLWVRADSEVRAGFADVNIFYNGQRIAVAKIASQSPTDLTGQFFEFTGVNLSSHG
jgi:hypothetical protein